MNVMCVYQVWDMLSITSVPMQPLSMMAGGQEGGEVYLPALGS